MIRTLHVIDQDAQAVPAVVLRLSVDSARFEPHADRGQHAWLLLGGEAMREAARAVGLSDAQFRLLPKPTGLHRVFPPALAAPRRLMQQAHRVVCWTEGAAEAASLMGCAHVVRRINDATRCPAAEQIIAQAHNEDAGSSADDRQALRQRWGVEPGTTVVALLGDRAGTVDAGAAVMALALTHEALQATDPEHASLRLLCHPLAHRRAEAWAFGEMLHMDHLLVQEAQLAMPWSVLPGCDAALAIAPDEAELSILWAQAAGVPVLSPGAADGTLSARSDKPRDLADTLTNWVRAQAAVPANA